jgi:hypothetical protein
MKRFMCFLTATWLLAGCSSPGGKGGPVSADTAMRSIDSSQMINNTTRLPNDSTTITVTQ